MGLGLDEENDIWSTIHLRVPHHRPDLGVKFILVLARRLNSPNQRRLSHKLLGDRPYLLRHLIDRVKRLIGSLTRNE